MTRQCSVGRRISFLSARRKSAEHAPASTSTASAGHDSGKRIAYLARARVHAYMWRPSAQILLAMLEVLRAILNNKKAGTEELCDSIGEQAA